MTIDIGYVAPILGFLTFLGFVVMLSIFQVYWKRIWGDEDDD